MGLGPKWESSFIHPGPPADGSPEWRRYVQQLHDQLTVVFEDGKRVLNQTIIGGDGDGEGTGVAGTTETDGGIVQMTTNYDSKMNWGGSNSQWVDQRFGANKHDNLTGTNFVWEGESITPGAGDIVRRYFVHASKDWAGLNLHVLNNGVSNNGVAIPLKIEYNPTVADGDDWDVAWTSAGSQNWTPSSVANELRIFTYVLVGVVEGTLLAIQFTIEGVATPNDQVFHNIGFTLT